MGALSDLVAKGKGVSLYDTVGASRSTPTGGGTKANGFEFLLNKVQEFVRHGLDDGTELLIAVEFDESIQDKLFMDFAWAVCDRVYNNNGPIGITVFDLCSSYGYRKNVSYDNMSWTKEIDITHPVVDMIPFINCEDCSAGLLHKNIIMVNTGGGPGYSIIEIKADASEVIGFIKWVQDIKNQYLKSMYLFTADGNLVGDDGEVIDRKYVNTGERRWMDGIQLGDDPTDFSDKFFLWMFRRRDFVNPLANFIGIICIDNDYLKYLYEVSKFKGSVHDFYDCYDSDFARTLPGWTYDVPAHIPLSIMAPYTNCTNWNSFSFEKGTRIVHLFCGKGYICVEMQGVASELVPVFSAFSSNCNDHVLSVRLYDTEGNRYLTNGRGRVNSNGTLIDDICSDGVQLSYDEENRVVLVNPDNKKAVIGSSLKLEVSVGCLFTGFDKLTGVRFTDFGAAELVFGSCIQPLVSLKSFEVEPAVANAGEVCVVPSDANDCSVMTLQNKSGFKVKTGALIRLIISSDYVLGGWLTSGNTYKLQSVYVGTDGQYWATIDGVEMPVSGIEDFDIVM